MKEFTLAYPVSLETDSILNEVQKYGKVIGSSVSDVRELHAKLSVEELNHLEQFLKEHDMPYDLMLYSAGIDLPMMKKVRPDADFSKEFNCSLYQNEEEVEDGVIAVSTLLSIISTSNHDSLAQNLLDEIKKHTFRFDDIENLFDM